MSSIRIEWKSSSHTIADILNWKKNDGLGLAPDFQRKEVWPEIAKIMLIDSILQNIPIPKIFVSIYLKRTPSQPVISYRKVIDGQQRLSAILSFLEDGFFLRKPSLLSEFHELKFSQLPEKIQLQILSYSLDFNELDSPSEDIERLVYTRINKYSKPLTRQELRKAEFPGEFLNLAQQVAIEPPFFLDSKFFSYAQIRRMSDVEYISELLALQLEGVQEKKKNLDEVYEKYCDLEKEKSEKLRIEFQKVLREIQLIFPNLSEFGNTRYVQKADFYSLFAALLELVRNNLTLDGKDTSALKQDLLLLNEYIAPSSDIKILSEYATKCISQANSRSSREFRKNFFLKFLNGTYLAKEPDDETKNIFKQIKIGIEHGNTINFENREIYWDGDVNCFQVSNAKIRSINEIH